MSTLLGMLFGVAGMGSSSAAVAVPLVGDEFGISVGVATWMISLYVLMLAVTTAIYGRVSDLVGVRAPLLVGVGLMAAGATAAALAPSYGVLLVARLFQGAGAAAIPVLGIAILTARYDGEVRGLAFGRLAGMAAALSCLGPLFGGLVENAVGWRGVMALPVLSLVVIPFIWRALTRDGTGASLDLVGAALVALTAAGLVLLVQSPSTGAAVAVVGSVLLVGGTPAVTARVRRRPHGFLPLEVVRNATVVRSAAAAAAIPAAWFAQLVAVPAVLVHDGWEPYQVGLLLVPSALLALLVPTTVTGPMLARLGASRSLAASAVGAAAALLLAGLGAASGSPYVLALAICLVTVAFGVGQPALSAAVGQAVHIDVRGVALGIATLVFLTGGSVGSAVVGGLGGVLGIGGSLAVLAALPAAGIMVLAPLLREPALTR
jgi:MFS family permease